MPRSLTQLARFNRCTLHGQKAIAEVAHCQAIARDARRAPGVQVVLLFQILLQSAVRINPLPEVVHLPADLLGPTPGSVWEEWKISVRFCWLGCRIGFGHDLVPRIPGCVLAGTITTPRPL